MGLCAIHLTAVMMWRSLFLLLLPMAASGALAPATQPSPLAGSFAGDRLSIEINPSQGDQYSGLIHKATRQFPFKCRGKGDQLTGKFTSDGNSFDFSATLLGDVLTLESGGATYRMNRQLPATTAPAPKPTRPAGLLLRNTHVSDPMTGLDAARLLVPDGWKCGIEAIWRQNPFDPADITGSVSDPTAPTALWIYPRLSFIDPTDKASLPVHDGSMYMGSEVRARFTAPADYVLRCLIPRFRRDISDPQIVFEADLPELARDQALKFQRVPGLTVQSTRLRISYRSNSRLMEEDFISTIGALPVSGQMIAWGAECESYWAPQGRLDQSMPLLRSIVSSLQVELGWYNCVKQVAQMMQQDAPASAQDPALLAHCIERTNSQISDAVQRSYEARARITARCNDDLNTVVPGIAVYHDRNTNFRRCLPAGFDPSYINAQGDVVLAHPNNPETGHLPDGWREMLRASR